jgi:hypothetical protein
VDATNQRHKTDDHRRRTLCVSFRVGKLSLCTTSSWVRKDTAAGDRPSLRSDWFWLARKRAAFRLVLVAAMRTVYYEGLVR